jgi:UDP-N-acetylglucosamine 2-epimerase (non-hydrolysing)
MTGTTELKVLTELENKVAIVIGTRPGIVMFSPIIRELRRREIPHFVVHTGQHYSPSMDQQLFDDLRLPVPEYKFGSVADAKLHGAQTAEMLRCCEQVFIEERPRLVLVGGDANTNLAAALAARKLHIQVGHVEAGERSYDWRMPEEHNRVMLDHISEYLFTTSEKGIENLRADGVRGRVVVSGNPIVDATLQNLALARQRASVLEELGIDGGGYLLMTLHREENVDSRAALGSIFEGVRLIREACDEPIVFAVHPRTQKRLREFGMTPSIEGIDGLLAVGAQGYLSFLGLAANAELILTDSGGVQQEACVLRVPCVTLRETTEWTETVALGANVLAGTHPSRMRSAVLEMRAADRNWQHPFGDGRSAERIADTVAEALDPSRRWNGPELVNIVADLDRLPVRRRHGTPA